MAGVRRNGNNFDLNRDFFTQSQDEVKASVAMMRDWLPVSMLDLHGYYDPTEVDGQTKPHNPGIEYDLYQPWNIGSASVDAQFDRDDFFEAGLWRPSDRTAPADVPILVHGTSTAAGSLARIAAFALDPLYRADPEREWPALASAIYWLDQ